MIFFSVGYRWGMSLGGCLLVFCFDMDSEKKYAWYINFANFTETMRDRVCLPCLMQTKIAISKPSDFSVCMDTSSQRPCPQTQDHPEDTQTEVDIPRPLHTEIAEATARMERLLARTPEFAACVHAPDQNVWLRHQAFLEHLLKEVDALRERHRAERNDWMYLKMFRSGS